MRFDEIIVTKSTGEEVPFSSEKLRLSLEKVGANEALIDEILKELERTIIDDVSTKFIRHKAFLLLKKKSRPIAARYNLRRSIMQLGPSGYPFEKYIGEILKYQGYHINVGTVVTGNCLDHELDVIAENGKKILIVECKYYNNTHKKSDTQTILYVHSRFNDVVKEWEKTNTKNLAYECWIANNTTFSKDAIRYAKCNGMQLLGWNYPHEGSLKQRVEISGLYPITCLVSLTKAEKKEMLDKGIVLARMLQDTPALLEKMKISANRIKRIIEEIDGLVINDIS